jgi:formylglycine-generating enzyme required for sulfatase activity
MVRVVKEVRRVLKPEELPQARPFSAPNAAPKLQRESWMSDAGIDAIGRWAEFTVSDVVQRMRWIEPGPFWMGSTEAERSRFGEQLSRNNQNRFDNEKPRHRVTLTRGFWLADTACTQDLWQALTGENPSTFTDDSQLPVEMVSWDQVNQVFLPELRRLTGDPRFDLPTEAQWEYACRAGSDTAYAFGDDISTAQANFDGNHPPPGAAKGLYRQATLPVKALPANAWGLHQMHGNVWEWCRDGPRTFQTSPARDPVGPADTAARVLRGGSWGNFAWCLRAANRNHNLRGNRYGSVGFRLCRASSGE